ncbi:hypothetical protein JHK85_045703 [Glycine max]|nr:hypothetical protein JHK87_044924 [Glycine soja]KAG4951836.1 hypothetical protein JHK85_045703 [Glycine max]
MDILQVIVKLRMSILQILLKIPGVAEASIRNLPPSTIGDASIFNAKALLDANKGNPMEGIVEQTRDGSTLRVYFLPEFQFVQAPQMGRRVVPESVAEPEVIANATNGDVTGEPQALLTSAQRLVAPASVETATDPLAPEAKFFTKIRVLNQDLAKDLALELMENASAKKAKDFLPFLHRSRKILVVVEYVLGGHRFKLLIPKETCSIAFSFSGVKCPSRDKPYSDEDIALMRWKIMQRDVESRTNMAITLVKAGLAKLQTSFGNDRIPDFHLLEQAEQSAKKQKLKIWENYVEGEEVSNGVPAENKQQEVLKLIEDQRIASIQQQLSFLNLQEARAFNPKKGDMVLCLFGADKSWYRAMVVNGPQGPVESSNDMFELFYIDYGNQEVVPYSHLQPIDPSVSVIPGIA